MAPENNIPDPTAPVTPATPAPPSGAYSSPKPVAATPLPTTPLDTPGAINQAPVSKPPESSKKLLMTIVLVLVILVAGGLLYALVLKKPAATTSNTTTQTAVASTGYLVYSDTQTATAIAQSGKQLYKTTLTGTNSGSLFYEATSPAGSILFSEVPKTASASGDQFILLDRNGKQKTVSDAANKSLNAAAEPDISHHIFFIDENNVAFVTCLTGSNCEAVRMSLSDGTTTPLFDTKTQHTAFAPPAYLLGTSPDKKSLYVGLVIPVGSDPITVYQVDASTGKTINTVKLLSEGITTLALSPDATKLVYKTGGNPAVTVLHTVDMSTGKETTLTWTKAYISDDTTGLQWSPDGTKVLFQATLYPADSTTTANTTILAYLDTSTNKVVQLQTVSDPAHHLISHPSWLSNGTIAYELDTSTVANDFSNSTTASYQQLIASKKITKLEAGQGLLTIVLSK